MKQSDVDLLKSLLIKKSKMKSENGALEINNTADGLKARIVELESKKLYQDTREGYNKLIYPYIDTTKTVNGITFEDVRDGTVIANGTATADAYFNLSQPELKAGTYLYSTNVEGSTSTFFVKFNTTNITSKQTLTFETDVTPTESYICIKNGTTVDNLLFKPMIIEGTEEKAFEQYGLKPSLDYESEVKGVTGNIEVLINNGLQSSESNYKSQLQEISLGSKVLYGNEIARDGIVLKDGKWNWKNNFKKYIIKNTDVFIQGTPNNRFYINTELNNKNYFAMSNYFKSGNEENFDVNSTIVLQSNRINLMTNNYTVEQLNARLKELNESGHPLYVVYPLAEAELEEITDSNLIKQLNYLLYHLIEYDDKTYITADKEIEFEALVEQDKLRILENGGNLNE